MKISLLLVVLLTLSSCATEKIKQVQNPYAGIREEKCGSAYPLNDNDIRMILYESKKQWDSIRAHVMSQKNKKIISTREEIDFAVQDREFSMYYDNALMLYLSGDTSSDFYRSLITIKQLFLIAEGCYPEIKKDIGNIDLFDDNCITVQPPEEDRRRTFLFQIKSDWDEMSANIRSLRFRGTLSDINLRNFEAMDHEFTSNYRNACMLYLQGDAVSDDFKKSLTTLEEIRTRSRKLLHLVH